VRASPGQTTVAAFAFIMAASAAFAQQTSPPHPGSANIRSSKARVVLLSEVKGDVALDDNTGIGLRKAFAHEPIAERFRLQTGTGRAEVEFEDNSTLRLAPYSRVEFSRLELLPSGAKASTISLLKGTAYVSLIPSYVVDNKGDNFLLIVGQEKLNLRPSNHIRIEIKEAEAQLAIFDGRGQIEGPFGTADLHRKRTLTFNLQGESVPVVEKKIHEIPFDNWDRWTTEYHTRKAGLAHPAGKGSRASSVRWDDLFR